MSFVAKLRLSRSLPSIPLTVNLTSTVFLEMTKIAHGIFHHDDGVHLTPHKLVDLSDLLVFEL